MSEQTKKKNPYKSTLNLPRTSFSMKANLVQREPQFQQRWKKIELARKMREAAHPEGPFVFHDGPPYANGDIHMGHLLNKVLKDLVVRTRTMLGYDVDFVPGWDCHGLPIEHKVLQELGADADEMTPLKIRRKCQSYAEKIVKLQSRQLQRLGTVGDYQNPYLTMLPDYEAEVLGVFASLVEQELIFRALKPVHWSIANQTALAEAELEYYDREDTSIYVGFELEEPDRLPAALGGGGAPAQLMIWTTTPWTLPANRAVAVAPGATYCLYRFERGGETRMALLAETLGESVLTASGAGDVEKLGSAKGRELIDAELCYRHPFLDDDVRRPLVGADYVTLDDGTGLVHTAPGHGADDYATGLREGLEIFCPVQADGTFDESVPEWLRGMSIWDANRAIVERIDDSGHLLRQHRFTHSYPHDWRGKTPVIFRATEQWFAGVDRPRADGDGTTLREMALAATNEIIRFVPEWGRNRMRGMLETRPDWCLSRQRSWGLPIPAFYGPEPGQVLLTPASIHAVAELIREKGSNVWFIAESEAELLAKYDWQADPAVPEWLREAGGPEGASLTRCGDIFDVWFESGSSWNAVLRRRGLGYPADLYLEGSDQHRGWFQLSLLPALGVTGEPPFRCLLTHGFIVDAKGMKLSKSAGNALAVEDLLRDHGADVCRWWVAGLNYANDVKVDPEFFGVAGEEYRKVRNTLRFLLSNIQDFDPARDRRELGPEDAASIDAWAADRLAQLIDTVREAYEGYQFRDAQQAIYHFCNEAMSAVYFAAAKDRLYCDATGSDRRRRCQTMLHDIADALCRLLAPILVHTADEALLTLRGEDLSSADCVHAQPLPEAVALPRTEAGGEGWDAVMTQRGRVQKALEDARDAEQSDELLQNPLDAGITLCVTKVELDRLQPFEAELADLCGVSRFHLIADGEPGVQVHDLRDEPRCERSWKRDGTVAARSDGGLLTDRDAAAVGV